MSTEAQPVETTETPESPEAVEGQGTDESSGLYSDYLSDIPSEFHDKVIDGFKAKDADFTRRFTAKSDQWKPYEELGVHEVEPEQLGGWLNLNKALEAAQGGDEQASENVYSWWEQLGEELGFYAEGEAPEANESDEEFDPFDPKNIDERVDRLVQQRLQEQVGPLQERISRQDEAQIAQQADQVVSDLTDSLKSDNPGLSDADVDDIMELALPYVEGAESPEAAIQQGFEKFKSLVSRGESDLFAKKLEQPTVPEGAGTPNTAPTTPTLANVKELAMDMARKRQAA